MSPAACVFSNPHPAPPLSIYLHPEFAYYGVELLEGVELDAQGAGAFVAAGADRALGAELLGDLLLEVHRVRRTIAGGGGKLGQLADLGFDLADARALTHGPLTD